MIMDIDKEEILDTLNNEIKECSSILNKTVNEVEFSISIFNHVNDLKEIINKVCELVLTITEKSVPEVSSYKTLYNQVNTDNCKIPKCSLTADKLDILDEICKPDKSLNISYVVNGYKTVISPILKWICDIKHWIAYCE